MMVNGYRSEHGPLLCAGRQGRQGPDDGDPQGRARQSTASRRESQRHHEEDLSKGLDKDISPALGRLDRFREDRV